MRYFMFLSYDGTAYHGWQVQPNADSVQQRINRALTLLLGAPTACVGAGRTDTGVHAAMMAAHFDTDRQVDGPQLAHKLCRILPQDIAVNSVRPVTDDAHARFSALSRTYHYRVYMRKDPFQRYYATRLPYVLDFERMNEAARLLLAQDDFASFSKTRTDVKTFICHVTRAQWVQTGENSWRFEITADRFLRNMVRAVVGTLIDVGRGRLTVDGFRDVMSRKDRCAAGESVPARALSLVDIQYPAHIFLDTPGA